MVNLKLVRWTGISCFIDVFGLPDNTAPFGAVRVSASSFLPLVLPFAGPHGSLGSVHGRGRTMLSTGRSSFNFPIVGRDCTRQGYGYLAVRARFMEVIAPFAVEEGSACVSISSCATTFLF